jgi:hypothetical protein
MAMKGLPILFVNLVDGTNVGVVECRGSLCLALKASQCYRVFGHLIRQEFQSHETAELDVLGLVHDAHTAATQLFENAIMGNYLAYDRIAHEPLLLLAIPCTDALLSAAHGNRLYLLT